MSCDIVVESILDTVEAKPVSMVVPMFREETYDRLRETLSVLTAEGIYRALEGEHIPYDQQINYHKYFHRDDHQFWGSDEKNENQQGGGETGTGSDKQKELSDKWTDISEKTQTNMETFYAEHGKEAGTLLQNILIENRERYDYRHFLRRFLSLREEIKVDPDSFDYAFYSYGLELYGNIPLLEPLEYQDNHKIHDFVIVIDTSDSCRDGTIQSFLAETRGILNQESLFSQDINLHIIQNDATVQMDTMLHSPEDFRQFSQNFVVKGYGGTDFRPAFDYVNRLIETGQLVDLKGLLYFTDGFGTYPKQRPPYETVFIFFRDQYQDTNVPPWAMKVILGPEELTEVKAHEY
jgi:predicted metal-dependent peptidase